MLEIQTFNGGIFETNAYLIQAPGGELLVDAPTGALDWLKRNRHRPGLLLITHGHVDHIDDAAKVVREYGCGLACHADSVPLLTDPEFFRRFGFSLEIEPVTPDRLLEESPRQDLLGLPFQILFVPGHCPGSLCFYHAPSADLFSGDVLFAGSIGRTDLPGGDHALLLRGLHDKVLVLPDDTKVYSGHGPVTTVGAERRSNPFLVGR